MKFYERFEQLCKTKDVKPTTALKEMGISASSKQKWENGSTVNSDNLLKLSDYFGVSVDYLLGYSEQPIQTINNQSINKGIQTNMYNEKTEQQLDEITLELINEFKKLSLKNKAEAIKIICEMVESDSK